MKISEYVFEFLKSKGVTYVFMLPGGGAMHLVDSLGKSGMDYIHFQHEQAATIAAESYGQHTNQIGTVLVTSGPGATNTITGVAAAWIDSTPMLVISGQAKRCDLIGDKGVRQIGSQEVAITEIVKPITKYVTQIYNPLDIRYCLEKAYHEATTGRKGPVWLDIPLDVQAYEINPLELKSYYEKHEENRTEKGMYDVRNILRMILNAKKPLILAGNGIISGGAENEFYSLLENFKIPVQTTWKSVDLMWEEHPLYVGHPGVLGDRGANYIIQECDLLISLGARVDNSITAFNEANFAPNAKKIVVDIDINELNKFTMKINEKVNDDVRSFLISLNNILEDNLEEIQKFNDDNYQWLIYCKNLRKNNPVILPEYSKKENYVDGYYFTGILSELLTEEDVIVPESSGVTAEITIQSFKSKKGQRMKHAAGLGSMGFAIPYSIGACLANENRRTIVIDGDGAIQLNIQELETLHRLQLPVKIFVWNNQGYASIRGMQRNNFNGAYVASSQDSGLTIPNILKLATAYGFPTFKIVNNKEVTKVIREVLVTTGPVICEVMIDPDEVVMPKVQAKIGKNGQMIPGRLDDMWPFID